VNSSVNFPSRFEPCAFVLLGLITFVAWALYAGPDLNWDLLNYHLYLGIHANGDAIGTDFYAAGPTAYLAPYAYWPLAKMVVAKWPAVVVGSMLAAIHSLVVIASWYCARQLIQGNTAADIGLRLFAVLTAVACPLVMTEIGTSFIDITAAIPVIFGIGLLLSGLSEEPLRRRRFVAAGMCFGFATALKLTGAPFAVAAFLALITLYCLRSDVRLSDLVVFGVGVAVGFVITYGYWGFRLWSEFHNPVFPFFQSFFEASEATASASAQASGPAIESSGVLRGIWDWLFSMTNRHQRFIPRDIADWILRPLYMIDPVANVYTEVRAPDARFLVLFCLMPFALWRTRANLTSGALLPLLLIFLFGWFLWMATTGNGRYMMPLALMAGPAIVLCGRAIWPRGGVVALSGAVILVFVQVALLVEGTQFRWAGSEWQSQFIMAKLPKSVTDHPVTIVMFDGQSASWLSAFVHRQSRFTSPGGPLLRAADGTKFNKFEQILERSDDIVAIFKFYFYELDGKTPFPPSPVNMGITAEAVGLAVDFDSCESGNLVETDQPRVGVFWHLGRKVERIATQGFFFCRAAFKPELKRGVPPDPVRDAAIANIEGACPRQFPPGGAATLCASTACWRTYASADTTLIITSDGAVLGRYYGAFQEPYLGNISELSHDISRLVCNEELGRYAPWSPGENLLSKTPRPNK
jgi:hypothetical protein